MNTKALLISIGIGLARLPLMGQQVLPLYQDSIPGSLVKLPAEQQPILTVYQPEQGKQNHAAILIFPGGGYSWLALEPEGTSKAKAFARQGFTAIVVQYRLPDDAAMRSKSIAPLQDAQQAVKMAREHAGEWGFDPNKVGIIGFSAGGHLAATLATRWKQELPGNEHHTNLRPDFVALFYPVITMRAPLAHAGSRERLLGNLLSEGQLHTFSCDEQVNSDTPPVYLSATEDDLTVDVNNSILFYQALKRNQVPAEMHLFASGNHGFTQRIPECAWMEPLLKWLHSLKILTP